MLLDIEFDQFLRIAATLQKRSQAAMAAEPKASSKLRPHGKSSSAHTQRKPQRRLQVRRRGLAASGR
jgi:hypothetical protein